MISNLCDAWHVRILLQLIVRLAAPLYGLAFGNCASPGAFCLLRGIAELRGTSLVFRTIAAPELVEA